jgi:hypothetical protein
MSGLVVTEAKSSRVPTHLRDHIPQAVGEMYACAKALGLVPSLSMPLISLNNYRACVGNLSSAGL